MSGSLKTGPRWLLVALAFLAGIGLALLFQCHRAGSHRFQAGASAWQQARQARLERGAGLLKKQNAMLRALPESFVSGVARGEKHLVVDAAADCVTTDRIGRFGDGGKWVCNGYRIQPPCVVYGVGAGIEISFEETMAAEYGCEVHVFDPSPTSRRLFGNLEQRKSMGKGSITFHPWGLGPVSLDPAQAMNLVIEGAVCEVKTLSDMARLLGHERVDILKLDIEGGEWAVLEDLRKRSLLERLEVQQLLLELHVYASSGWSHLADAVESLNERGYLLFRKELNPYGVECCAEYAFAARAFLMD